MALPALRTVVAVPAVGAAAEAEVALPAAVALVGARVLYWDVAELPPKALRQARAPAVHSTLSPHKHDGTAMAGFVSGWNVRGICEARPQTACRMRRSLNPGLTVCRARTVCFCLPTGAHPQALRFGPKF